ncbi:MAG: M23 family metallopeptidase [Nitrospiraceae bacterium]|nr:MAG: M23 family metallopeptidase [Nitrospiraceae bacterium]
MNMSPFNNRAGFSRVVLILILPFFFLVVAYGVYRLFFMPDPVVDGLAGLELLSADTTVQLSSENIKAITITVYQDGNEVSLLTDRPVTAQKAYTLHIKPGEMGLADGKAFITVKAEGGILKKVQYDLEAVIDTAPPVLDVIAATSIVYQGGGGFAVMRAAGEDSVVVRLVEKGKETEEQDYRAFRVAPGGPAPEAVRSQAGSVYYAFFPAPFGIGENSVFYAVATDRAGNQSIRSLPSSLKPKQYDSSSITIDDGFITRVVSPLLNETEVADPEAAFRKVNEEWRQKSLEALAEISKNTEPVMLWKGSFLQLKNSKVMATYGDQRTYRYQGKDISRSVHLGYDLASFARAPAEAANDGLIRYADDLSIYGNTVIIDHGMGLMSLYGHLSSIAVAAGEEVKKGQIIGTTGATGLAGGDHLHFGILIQGVEVSPLYWWDKNWIKTNVLDLILPGS